MKDTSQYTIEELVAMAASVDPELRRAAAADGRTPKDELQGLLGDPVDFVRAAVMANDAARNLALTPPARPMTVRLPAAPARPSMIR